jgi:hypothetical protein
MPRERVIMEIAEYTKTEVVCFGDVDATIAT